MTGALCVPAWATNTAKIHFEQTVYDFGKTSQVETVTGTFKFKNVGDGVLKIEAPKPSCGCTVASLKPDTLPPGETGELVFALNLGRSRATMEKIITVKSNDPQTPEVLLTIKVDYTPLYDINPIALAPSVPFGGKATNLFVTITRTDGKPLGIQRLEPSKPWVTAQVKVEPGAKADASTARILIEVQPDGPPRRFNEYVHVYEWPGIGHLCLRPGHRRSLSQSGSTVLEPHCRGADAGGTPRGADGAPVGDSLKQRTGI